VKYADLIKRNMYLEKTIEHNIKAMNDMMTSADLRTSNYTTRMFALCYYVMEEFVLMCKDYMIWLWFK